MWKGALVWFLLLLVLPLGMLFLVQRPLAVAACPACFGLEKIQGGVYVEAAMSKPAREYTLKVLADSEARVAQFYGEMRYRPRVLVCSTQACFERIGGGGTRVGSISSFALLVSPEGSNIVLMSHELPHVELHGRVGFWHMFLGAVPAWFDEGVAVLVSDDPTYLAPPRKGKDRCLVEPEADMPAEPGEWRDRLQEEGNLLYDGAACQVDVWMIAKGGPGAITGLLDKLRAGEDFDTLYK